MEDKTMRIMHIAQSAGYGVTMYIEIIIRGLMNKEDILQYLLGSEYYNQPRFKKLVDKLISIPMDREITKRDFLTILKCRNIIKQEHPDIVYCHSAKAGIYGRLACLGTSTKVIYNPHGWAFNMKCGKLKKIFYKIVECGFAFITNKIICISDYEKRTVPNIIPKRKLVVIKNGINIEQCKNLLAINKLTREKLNIPPNAYVIGMIARISHQKGHDLFIQIAQKVKQRIPNAFFLIVGGKSDDIPIEELIETANLSDCFHITGEVNHAIQYASLFDIAVLTSRWEGFGLVLPEYMVAKKPIIAYNVDAIPEIINHNINGLLVKPESIQEFTNAIYQIYSQPYFAHSLVENASKIVAEKFDIKRVINEHETLFKQL
ncbi:glycosyltransferase family 4 protein [Phocaeicola plebeius]|uniref:glycosyltransferase family 4 protein n=1 Tax=Phocaeicola plebeius TaxID=310297 RepID=UPI00307D4A86